jgi:hypothetical protein
MFERTQYMATWIVLAAIACSPAEIPGARRQAALTAPNPHAPTPSPSLARARALVDAGRLVEGTQVLRAALEQAAVQQPANVDNPNVALMDATDFAEEIYGRPVGRGFAVDYVRPPQISNFEVRFNRLDQGGYGEPNDTPVTEIKVAVTAAEPVQRIVLRQSPGSTLIDSTTIDRDGAGVQTAATRPDPDFVLRGVYTFTVTLASSTFDGWFIATRVKSSDVPIIATRECQLFTTGLPTLSWLRFVSRQFDPRIDRRRLELWSNLHRTPDPSTWREAFRRTLSDADIARATVGMGDLAGIGPLEDGVYRYVVDSFETRQFGPIDVSRESAAVHTFRISSTGTDLDCI